MTSDPTEKPAGEMGQNFTSWNLPDVTSTASLSSAEKEARERKNHRFRKPKKTGPVDEAAGESIEIVETIEETYKPLTAEQLQAITEAAEKEGYQAGYEKGIEAGCAEGEKRGFATGIENGDKKVADRCERIERLIEALLIPLQAERKKLEILVVDMICQLTEAVVLREIDSDSSQIVKLVDAAINAVPSGSDKFSLYLAEQDIALVKSHLNDQSDKQFTFYTDENLLPGGCRLETKNSVVSNTVEQRLKKVIDDFMHKRIAASDEQIEAVKNTLDESVQNATIEDTVDNSSPSLENSSEHSPEHSSKPIPALKTSQNNADELSENTSTTNYPNVENDIANEQIEATQTQDQQEQTKTTESMTPLESAQQQRDEQIPKANNIYSEEHKPSGQEGKNDAPI